MHSTKKFISIIGLMGALLLAVPSQAQDDSSGHQIVFQLTDDDPKVQAGLLRQLNNLTTGWPRAQFEVVCHSGGIDLLLKEDNPLLEDLMALDNKGVTFTACENTMRSHDLDRSQIVDFANYVPMGIAEVVKKQEAGWSYIKAGK